MAVALCGLAAYLFKQPMLFPSLGPSALLFLEKPTAPESSPYNAVVGHLVGILAGVAPIAVFGLLDAASVLEVGVTLARVGAAALSVALVALILPPLRATHPRPGRPPCWSASGCSTSQASSPGSWPGSCCSPPSPGR